MYCSSKLLVPTTTGFDAPPSDGKHARTKHDKQGSPTADAISRQRERSAKPSSASASNRSTTSASAAAAIQPKSTNTQFSVCSPVKI